MPNLARLWADNDRYQLVQQKIAVMAQSYEATLVISAGWLDENQVSAIPARLHEMVCHRCRLWPLLI
jgi:hypothetical protein